MVLYIALLVALTLPARPSRLEDAVARYQGGTVTRKEYSDWLAANGIEDLPDKRRNYLEAIALAESLEAAARQAGLDRDPHNAFRLAQIETGLLTLALRQETDRAIVVGEAEVEAELKAEEKLRFQPRTVQLRNIFKRARRG